MRSAGGVAINGFDGEASIAVKTDKSGLGSVNFVLPPGPRDVELRFSSTKAAGLFLAQKVQIRDSLTKRAVLTGRKPSLKSAVKNIADKVLLRGAASRTQDDLSSLALRLQLIDRKLDYITATLQAYAEAEDNIDTALHSTLKQQHRSTTSALASIATDINRSRAETKSDFSAVASDIEHYRAESKSTFDSVIDNIEKNRSNIIESIHKSNLAEFRQIEAFSSLQRELPGDIRLSATRGWAASPDVLLYLYREILRRKPAVVVELGSGVSTLVIAAGLREVGKGGQLYSLDHSGEYAEETRQVLRDHGLVGNAAVFDAPLVTWTPPRPTRLGEEWLWYSLPREVSGLSAIDWLLVDGPPKATGQNARFPAVPQWRDRMVAGGMVFLDDAARKDEKVIAAEWSAEWHLTLDYHREFEKGLAVLTAVDTPISLHQR